MIKGNIQGNNFRKYVFDIFIYMYVLFGICVLTDFADLSWVKFFEEFSNVFLLMAVLMWACFYLWLSWCEPVFTYGCPDVSLFLLMAVLMWVCADSKTLKSGRRRKVSKQLVSNAAVRQTFLKGTQPSQNIVCPRRPAFLQQVNEAKINTQNQWKCSLWFYVHFRIVLVTIIRTRMSRTWSKLLSHLA